MNSDKIAKRVQIVVLNAFANMSAPMVNMLCSLLVIRLISPELWGAYTKILLWFLLGLQLVGFGNKEFLLREFSKRPTDIIHLWANSLRWRALLMFAGAIVVFFLPFDSSIRIILAAWFVVRFLYSSFDALVLFQKKFLLTVMLELFGFIAFCILLYLRSDSSGLLWLLSTFLTLDILKTLVLVSAFFTELKGIKSSTHEFSFYEGAFPFFLLSISGMIGSRTDMYMVSVYLDKVQIAQYSVLLNFLIYLQALSNFIFQPFIKNIYRINIQSTRKLSRQLFGTGILVAGFGVPLVWWVCAYFFKIQFNLWMALTGIFYVLPVFYYLPRIYFLYKTGKEQWVLYVNLGGIILNFLLNLFWLPSFGISGALMAATVVQLASLLMYSILEKKLLRDVAFEMS